MSDGATGGVIAVVVADVEVSPIGTASRLLTPFDGVSVIRRTLTRLTAVGGLAGVYVLAPAAQHERLRAEVGDLQGVALLDLARRSAGLDARVRVGRAPGLYAWRGGVGQWTVFDEDYHPAGVAAALDHAGQAGVAAEHVLVVPGHAALLDVEITAALVQHHVHKNHEMRLTYTPAAPGLSGMVLQASIAREMAAANVLPGQLLAYDPKAPTFDTLIRDACMQVDPALSKVANRFLLDTQRAWDAAERIAGGMPFACAADMARAAAAGRGARQPVEVEIELTARRRIRPPGAVPEEVAAGRGELGARHWVQWLQAQRFMDDVMVTFGGDGDPLLYAGLGEVLAAARGAGFRCVHVQTDLLGDVGPLLGAIRAGAVDVVSVNFPGDDAATYARVAGVDAYAEVVGNLEALSREVMAHGGMPLVVGRLLKTRETIPQMEAFFDRWILAGAWAVMDPPTDRAGGVAFAGVVDMAPPRRRGCRRLDAALGRLVVHCDGTAAACGEDMAVRLRAGHIEAHSLEAMWLGEGMTGLRVLHGAGRWGEVSPCAACREWHRA